MSPRIGHFGFEFGLDLGIFSLDFELDYVLYGLDCGLDLGLFGLDFGLDVGLLLDLRLGLSPVCLDLGLASLVMVVLSWD